MSYPAAQLKQEIARRMKGECRVNLLTGRLISLDGEARTSCADCESPCEQGKYATGQMPGAAGMIIQNTPGGAKLTWPCPCCGNSVVEGTSVLDSFSVAVEIANDPLCFSCRGKEAGKQPASNGIFQTKE